MGSLQMKHKILIYYGQQKVVVEFLVVIEYTCVQQLIWRKSLYDQISDGLPDNASLACILPCKAPICVLKGLVFGEEAKTATHWSDFDYFRELGNMPCLFKVPTLMVGKWKQLEYLELQNTLEV